METRPGPASIDEYIARQSAPLRPRLQAVRATVQREAPRAQERISYGLPAFFQGKALVYFGAFSKHLGLYPPVADVQLRALLAPYAGPKGNLQFPWSEPLPLVLVARVVQARLAEIAAPRPRAGRASRSAGPS